MVTAKVAFSMPTLSIRRVDQQGKIKNIEGRVLAQQKTSCFTADFEDKDLKEISSPKIENTFGTAVLDKQKIHICTPKDSSVVTIRGYIGLKVQKFHYVISISRAVEPVKKIEPANSAVNQPVALVSTEAAPVELGARLTDHQTRRFSIDHSVFIGVSSVVHQNNVGADSDTVIQRWTGGQFHLTSKLFNWETGLWGLNLYAGIRADLGSKLPQMVETAIYVDKSLMSFHSTHEFVGLALSGIYMFGLQDYGVDKSSACAVSFRIHQDDDQWEINFGYGYFLRPSLDATSKHINVNAKYRINWFPKISVGVDYSSNNILSRDQTPMVDYNFKSLALLIGYNFGESK